MSTPPLPEVFGNYALGEDFSEVLPPDPVSWWPQTAGWAVMAAAVGLYIAYRGWLALRRWHRNRYRREACRELQRLARECAGPRLSAELSALLKRTALAAFPRREVAALSGARWVDFLNSRCQQPLFSGHLADALGRQQYLGAILAPPEREALMTACQTWIISHRGERDA